MTEHTYPCAWDIMCDYARMGPDYPAPTLALIVRRLARFGMDHLYSDDSIQAAHRAHFDVEHHCPVLSDHLLSRPCRLGMRHKGCCPGRHRRLVNGHERYYPLPVGQ